MILYIVGNGVLCVFKTDILYGGILSQMKKALLGVSAVLSVCGAYLLSKDNSLTVYEYEIASPKVPEEFEGFRIVQLSDLHCKRYGENDEELVRVCAGLSPDIIVFTGDLYSRSCDMADILSRLPLMRGLRELAPVYYIWGNHEVDVPDKAKHMNERLSDIGITILRNERARFFKGASHIDIFGLELPSAFYRSPEGSYRSLPEVTTEWVQKRLGAPDKGSFSVLLAHTPLPFASYSEWGANLTFSGHIHGGMVRIGNIGLLSPERKFLPRYTKGIYRRGDSQMIVSTGLGKPRVNNPEMIALCVLKTVR